MITVENLTYTYPGATKETLHGLNFTIEKGQILGFLGPSGAGKSTTQKILIGLLKGYIGSVKVMDRELRDWGQDYYERIGVSFELPNHYLRLTGRENLSYFASLYSGETEDPMTLLEMVGLAGATDLQVRQYSKGMKGRLNVARSLVNKPDILFLDEPASGLDPVNARRIKDIVLEKRAQGATVFVTTHNMMVADELSDQVAFMLDGNIHLLDTPKALKQQYGKRSVDVAYQNGSATVKHAEFAIDGLGDNAEFLRIIKENHIDSIHTQETTLENIFIEVTGEELNA